MTDILARLRAALEGRYRVDREVGAGGMATVYLAHDEKHGRQVAIKVLLPDLAVAVGPDRFLREIKLTSTLQHPHILPLYDSGEVDGLVYYVMPFVEGESLRARLERVKQLSVREALDIARAVASALDYAHRRNVVHRDIKPENILLGTDGQHAVSGLQAVVADFGVAVAVASADKARLTATGVAIGTPAYMSPEQASAEPGLGPSTDVYALGAVLYEMLIGEPPFTGPTAQAILARSASEFPVAPQLRRPTVPAAVDRAIMTALAKVPTDRFASAGSFAEALQTDEHVIPSALHRRSRGAAAFPWAVAGVLALALVMQVARRPEPAPTQGLVKSMLLAPPGEEFSDRDNFGALSRDGRLFAFVVQPGRGAARLWVRNMDELGAQPLAGTEGASAPFWSPDGRSLAFFADDELRRIAASGGATVVLAAADNRATGTWGPGNRIYFSSAAGIMRVSAGERGREQPELVFKSDSGLRRPSMGDDPNYILLTGGLGNLFRGDTRTGTLTKVRGDAFDGQLAGNNAVLYVGGGGSNLMLQGIDLAHGVMVGDPHDLGGPVRAGSNQMSFTTSMSGTAAFLLARAPPGPVVVDRRGSVIDTIRAGGFIPSVGHRPSSLALGSDAGLHRYDLERKRPTPIHKTTGLAVLALEWSPDDSRIAFSEFCSLGVIEPGGAGLRHVAGSPDTECLRGVTDWWSEDRVLVNKTVGGRASEIWEYRISDGTGSPVVTRDVAAIDGSVSPDGRLLAYAQEESGTFDVFVRPLREDGAGDRISLEGGRAPRWRGDGRELYFVTAAGDVMAADVAPGPRPIGAPKLLFRAIGWERSFFRDSRFRPFDVSIDGQRFYLAQSRIEGPAVLLQNLHSALRADPPRRK